MSLGPGTPRWGGGPRRPRVGRCGGLAGAHQHRLRGGRSSPGLRCGPRRTWWAAARRPPVRRDAPAPVASAGASRSGRRRRRPPGEAVVKLMAEQGAHLNSGAVRMVDGDRRPRPRRAQSGATRWQPAVPKGAYSPRRARRHRQRPGRAADRQRQPRRRGRAPSLEQVRWLVGRPADPPGRRRSRPTSTTPARALALDSRCSSLSAGLRADVIMMGTGLTVQRVLQCGPWL